jgi:glycosyltransferase involved in cell wall biosynthesis
VIALLDELHRDGYAIGVACEPDSPIAEAARERSIPTFPCKVGSGGNPSRAAIAALQLAGAISHLQAQILHTHSFAAGLVGALATPLAGSARMVATIHNYPPNAVGMKAGRAQHRWAVRRVVRRASRVITVSEALRRDLLDICPGVAGKTLTIANGIDTRAKVTRDPTEIRAELGIGMNNPVVGMIARLAPQKGIAEFIRACRTVADRWPDVAFVLAGDGPLKKTAESLRDELELQDKLRLPGEVELAGDLISAMDVLVVASISEGSSMVAMEAMAREKPVVATRVGGVPEVVVDGETGIVVNPGDPQALAAGIQTLLGNTDLARDMGERGRRRAAERFDIQLMFEKTKQVYADVFREAMRAGGARA